jgi:hemerythrin-like metal-binding protein
MEAEHRIQLRLLAKVQEALVRQSGRDGAAVLLRQLLDYSEAHFLSEQILMREHSYPGYEAHVAEHDQLLEKLRVMVVEWESGHPAALAERASRVEDWLLAHMRTTDHALERYFLELRAVAP